MKENEQHQRTVLMTADTIGGVWTYCIDLITSMVKRNTHFHLVTAGRSLTENQRTQLGSLPNVTLHETEYKLEWMPSPWHDIDFSGWELVELERKLKPDIIHLNSYSYAALPFRAPVLVVAHSDVFSWWFSVKKSLPGREWQEYFRRVKDGLRHTNVLVAPSQTMLNMLLAIYGSPADVRVIHNGRNSDAFFSATKENRVMCAGRFWDEGKNLSLLAEASQFIDAPVTVAGETCSGNNQGHDNMHYLGRLTAEEMAIELSRSLVFASPAKYEPFGLSILEAALSGCALVLGNIASLKEIWKDAALYVDTDDPVKLSSICNELLRKPDVAAAYGRKAMQRAAIFTIEKMAIRYHLLYNELTEITLPSEKMQIA